MTKSLRGIVLLPDVEVDGNTLTVRSSEPDPQWLRQAILYWDKIDFPQNNLIRIASPDINFLQQEGIAQQTQVTLTGSFQMAHGYLMAQLTAFIHLNKEEPGMWTMGQIAKQFINLPNKNSLGKVIDLQLIEIEINNELPVPPADTPLDDILQVKQKRKDEFAALRSAVDELFDDVLDWENKFRGKRLAVLHLQQVIKDIQKIVDQSWLVRKSSITWEYNLAKIPAGAIGGSTFAQHFGLDAYQLPLSIAGALIAPVSIKRKTMRNPFENLPSDIKNFAALYYLEKQIPGSIKKS
ncbi:DUF6236 family protein [Legionella sp. 31fI33]|uniref:DUF6236 family protein n=1 Tax=Legionella sp. 31fI33 TaxID=2886376 RepID=UPI001E50D3A1|nr:DUF6236 family protein [Legionella sp. 31fI33]MCC5016053.1 DUF6236 family protein [Legionella sp. 31fI33]